jgi:molecular chaperone DnaJ
MPRLSGFGTGDLLVKIKVEIPKNLSSEEKDLIKRYANIRGESLS